MPTRPRGLLPAVRAVTPRRAPASRGAAGPLALAVLLAVLAALPVRPVSAEASRGSTVSVAAVVAQAQQGATMTVLRGQVAVIRADGSAVQPAPSGTTVNAGDEIRTLGSTGALITFFSGTEIEMGENTILAVEQVSRQGDRIEVSLRQVLGATVSRVQSLTGSGSTYRIEAGGAVALVRGTTFALIGPVATSSGNVVAIVCLEDCGPASTFSGCPLAPYTGYGVVVERGRVTSECLAFSVDRSAGLFDAAFEAVTTVEQQAAGDTRGIPPGQVALGQRQETNARARQREREEDQDRDHAPNGLIPPSPPGGIIAPCDTVTNSGGAGVTTTRHDVGRSSGSFQFSYDAFNVPDRFQIEQDGRTIFDTGFVSGSNTVTVPLSGSSRVVTVTVTGSSPGTFWTYEVGCAT